VKALLLFDAVIAVEALNEDTKVCLAKKDLSFVPHGQKETTKPCFDSLAPR
jgi:hypothetical protein